MSVNEGVAQVDMSGFATVAPLKREAMLTTFEVSQPAPFSPCNVAETAPSKLEVMSTREVVFQVPRIGSADVAPINMFAIETTELVSQPVPLKPTPVKEVAP
jgi:hypothetical protein